MTTLELLRQRSAELGRIIGAASDQDLRRIARAVAEAAVGRVGLSDPVIMQALEHLRVFNCSEPQLTARVHALAEQMDEDYFAVNQPYDERDESPKTAPEVVVACS